jgi:hypothetical protein
MAWWDLLVLLVAVWVAVSIPVGLAVAHVVGVASAPTPG